MQGAVAEAPLASYDFTYKGGLLAFPTAKIGKIVMQLTADSFVLNPTTGSKFWSPLTIDYGSVTSVEVTERTVSTF